MKRVFIKSLIATVALAAVGVASAQDKTIKFANQNTAGHPIVLGMEKFKEIVEKNSGGKIKVNVFPGGALGSDQANVSAIQGGTLDMGMSSFTDTKERQQSVDFVDYFSAGTQWAQRPNMPIDPNDACGKKVAVQATTVQETEELPAKSQKCVDAGKPEIQIVKFDSQDAATNAVILGQVDAMSADSPVTAYAIKQSNGKLEAAGEIFEAAPYGWPVKKGSPLAESLVKALEHLIQTGDYKTIATNWGVEKGVIDKPVINGATS